MYSIAIFASGGGSNAAKIIEHFRHHSKIKVALVVTNKASAGVVNIADTEGIPVLKLGREKFMEDGYVEELKSHKIDWIILAGFLWKVPPALLSAFPGKIINIHPALLPKYGGKGMYGHHVHKAVIEAGEKESGMTIHFVDGEYDHGGTIFQARCAVLPGDTPETLAARVLQLEHGNYARVIEKVILQFGAGNQE